MQLKNKLKLSKVLIPPLLVLTSLSGCNNNDVEKFKIELKAGYEVPQLQHDFKANAELNLDLDARTLSGSIELENFIATSAHIHQGFLGENGPSILTFDIDSDDPTRLILASNTLTEGQIERLHEGGIYINVYTENYPNGALRAQILTDSVSVKAFGIVSSQSIPTVFSDGEATGYVTINDKTNTLTINAHTNELVIPTEAHLHQATIAENGEVIVSLENNISVPNHWFAKTTALTQEQIEAAQNSEFYIDFHSDTHITGEVRGQLTNVESEIINFELDSLQESLPFNSPMSGKAVALVDHDSNNLTLVVDTENVDSIIGVQINSGEVRKNGEVLYSLIQDSENTERFTLDEQLMTDDLELLKNNQLYVNVLTAENLDGAIRGQMLGAPSNTGLLLDPESLVNDSKLFHVTFGGQFLGTATIDIELANGVATFTEVTDVPAFGVDETLIGTIDQLTGSPVSYMGTGISGSRNIDINLNWTTAQVTGTTDTQPEPVDIELPHNALETLSLFYMAHAMPLAEGIEIDLPVFNGLDTMLYQRTLTVEAVEEVTVAAGTFETFKVLIGGHPEVNQYLYITTEAPRKLVQIGFDRFPTMFYELQP